jgi:hypothetical protein
MVKCKSSLFDAIRIRISPASAVLDRIIQDGGGKKTLVSDDGK